MAYEFVAYAEPDAEQWLQFSSLSESSPFNTRAYCSALELSGKSVVLLCLKNGGSLTSGCAAFVSIGRFRKELEIVSLPNLPDESSFWHGLRAYCNDECVTDLIVGTFDSERADIPSLGREIQRKNRVEYVVDLQVADASTLYSSNHIRNIRKAEKQGVVISESTSYRAAKAHVESMSQSISRRQNRGERLEDTLNPNSFFNFARAGIGEFVQAQVDGEPVSSVLILTAKRSAYYHSAGSTKTAMKIGASHFLISETIMRLKRAGYRTFNLGGATEEQAGLIRFKSGFGAKQVHLESAFFRDNSLNCVVKRLRRRPLLGMRHN